VIQEIVTILNLHILDVNHKWFWVVGWWAFLGFLLFFVFFISGCLDLSFLGRFLPFLGSLPLLSCLIFVAVFLHVPFIVAVEAAYYWFDSRDVNLSCVNIHSIFVLGPFELSLWVLSSPYELFLEVGFVRSDLDINEPMLLHDLSSCSLPFIQSD